VLAAVAGLPGALTNAAEDLRALAIPRRVAVPAAAGGLAATVTLLGVALRIGLVRLPLLGGGLIGVGDNGDAFRLFCTAGLTPDTPSRFSLWRGVVVTGFTTGAKPCTAAPSSSATLLRLVVPGDPGLWSLTSYAWLLAGVAALGAGLGAAALAAVGPARAALVAIPLVPLLVVSWWSRFLVSLYAEPAALVGTVWVLTGLLVVGGTRPADRVPRLVALGLLALGGLVAATAKPGFIPVGGVALLCCALVVVRAPTSAGRPRRVLARLAGPLVALALLVGAASPVAESIVGQDRSYGAVNAHNLIFTALMPALGPDTVMPAVGLPPAAGSHSGEGFYWAGGFDIPGWTPAIGDRPAEARATARTLIAEHPEALATMVGRGLTATMRPQLPYLPSAPRGTAPEHFEGLTPFPEAGPQTTMLLGWLAGIGAGWLPLVTVLLALAAGATTLLPRARRADPLAIGLVRVAAGAALLGLGIVTLAVLGDGYYELSKHVWLGSYCFAATGLSGAAAAVVAATRRYRRAGPA
jgi:hypothetical protein